MDKSQSCFIVINSNFCTASLVALLLCILSKFGASIQSVHHVITLKLHYASKYQHRLLDPLLHLPSDNSFTSL